ncbi:hypothetical protein F4779DRAFT_162387 [Xylariaceae sp. FL0662B]|nr:hypothetical protein F4779DRAFT_162387 [Xylariaceae sp. FL0662B]
MYPVPSLRAHTRIHICALQATVLLCVCVCVCARVVWARAYDLLVYTPGCPVPGLQRELAFFYLPLGSWAYLLFPISRAADGADQLVPLRSWSNPPPFLPKRRSQARPVSGGLVRVLFYALGARERGGTNLRASYSQHLS